MEGIFVDHMLYVPSIQIAELKHQNSVCFFFKILKRQERPKVFN